MDPLLSKYQCGFRKGFSAQNCLMAMLEKWKSSVDKGNTRRFNVKYTWCVCRVVNYYMTFQKHLIVCHIKHCKLNAYGFSFSVPKLMQSYLTERKQKTKINHAYRYWKETLFGMPQGSILGPILFNIFLSGLFLIKY